MGLGGISPWQLLILLAIVLAIFGTKKLRNVGGDLGAAMRDFRGAMREGDDKNDSESEEEDRVVDQQDGASAPKQARNSNDAQNQTKETADKASEHKS